MAQSSYQQVTTTTKLFQSSRAKTGQGGSLQAGGGQVRGLRVVGSHGPCGELESTQITTVLESLLTLFPQDFTDDVTAFAGPELNMLSGSLTEDLLTPPGPSSVKDEPCLCPQCCFSYCLPLFSSHTQNCISGCNQISQVG